MKLEMRIGIISFEWFNGWTTIYEQFNYSTIPQFERFSGITAHHDVSNGFTGKSTKQTNDEQIVGNSFPAHYAKIDQKPVAALDSISSFGESVFPIIYV